jgi:hypothetical protein
MEVKKQIFYCISQTFKTFDGPYFKTNNRLFCRVVALCRNNIFFLAVAPSSLRACFKKRTGIRDNSEYFFLSRECLKLPGKGLR